MEIAVENSRGERLELKDDYKVVDVDGLTPATATINTDKVAIVDGEHFNSSYVNARNIVLTIVPEGEPEKARLELYRYFKPKYFVKVFFKTKYRNVYVDGYVETFGGTPYSQKQSFQVSILCPGPFFHSVDKNIRMEQETEKSNFVFPFFLEENEGIAISEIIIEKDIELINEGQETGIVIELLAKGTVINPVIYNRTTGQKFGIKTEMNTGETIIIDSRTGKKSINMIKNGGTTNYLNKIQQGSKWLTLVEGKNMILYSCEYGENNLRITYTIETLYEGI